MVVFPIHLENLGQLKPHFTQMVPAFWTQWVFIKYPVLEIIRRLKNSGIYLLDVIKMTIVKRNIYE